LDKANKESKDMKPRKRIQCVLLFSCACLSLVTCSYHPGEGTFYYVATNGDDSNPGTESSPWKTLGKAASMAKANVTVFLKQGTYHERLIPQYSGTADGPITFTAYPGDLATIDGSGISFPSGGSGDRWWNGLIHIEGLSYITISGLRVTGSEATGILARYGSHITIEDNFTFDTYSPGICVHTSSQSIVVGNEVVQACTGNDQEAISIVASDHFEVTDNTIHDGQTEGIDAKVGCSYGIISRNLVYNQQADRDPPGIYLDAWDGHEHDIEVFDNISHDNGHGFVICSENGGLIESINVHHNTAYNNNGGFLAVGWGIGSTHPIRQIELNGNVSYGNQFGFQIAGFTGTTIDGIKVTNNIIRNNVDTGMRITEFDTVSAGFVMRNVEIINNTIHGNGTTAGAWEDGGINISHVSPENILVRNNILSGNAAYTICVQPDVPSGKVVVDHNLFQGFRSFANETQGSNPTLGDPAFVDSGNSDFHLTVSSAAIDAGSADNAPSVDLDGIARPQGSRYDLGAFEFVP
jgi:hypothetical protein